ncbi:efflux RND transporter periplasmic adaptor subunit [Filibacter tadaridae]|uniref:Efflux system component YknX n=1 Tax=Filibacter tadaridae TaxID=2483811 RepID=A0A3P5WHX1_9BACL|nr:efflux RND transporter periplasmic adaptor subunit [Filibacter tadaridae]VDC19087.1 hypothetical protein FILTAD_00206 [Filibacter tadaridae]
MNKWVNIAVAIAVSAFLAINMYLLFSNKSVIPKAVYVDQYERMTSSDVNEKLAKEGFIAPMETYTVYIGNEEIVDTWLVKEGDAVTVGDDIASLQTERADGQRSVWEAEREALLDQQYTLSSTISELESDRADAKSDSSSKVNKQDNVNEGKDDKTIKVGLNVDVQVDVAQDGSFAQAIGAAEQELATVERRLIVIDAQLSQDSANPSIVSPVNGVIANVTRHGENLAVDIYSSQQVIVTYAKNDEWQKIGQGDRVLAQGDGIEKGTEGTVLSVSAVPANDDKWLQAYKAMDSTAVKNPLAYNEIRIALDPNIQQAPFGTNVNAIVIVNEAQDAISLKEDWLLNNFEGVATVPVIDKTGRAKPTKIQTPFSWKTRAVVSNGLKLGDIVVYEPNLAHYTYTPQLLLPLPTDVPGKADWKAFGWKNYVKYMTVK